MLHELAGEENPRIGKKDWIAAVNLGKTNTALGAYYHRLGTRVGKAKAITATARKMVVLFYNAGRFGMEYVDPGQNYYEQRYRQGEIDIIVARLRNRGLQACHRPHPPNAPPSDRR